MDKQIIKKIQACRLAEIFLALHGILGKYIDLVCMYC